MIEVTDNQHDGLLGASVADLIEMIKEKDQALQEVTDVNYKLSCERDMFRREAEDYRAICLKFQIEELRRQQAGVQT